MVKLSDEKLSHKVNRSDFRLAVITTAFFPEADIERQLRMFLTSAYLQGVVPIPYGIDEPYCIWADMKIVKKIPFLERLRGNGFTHVLYTDARDAFFTGSLSEIVHKYEYMGSPKFLASTERTCNPNEGLKEFYPPISDLGYNYHCVGGYIAKLDYAIEIFKRMATYRERSGDDAEIWQWAWQEGWFRPSLDRECRIFQTISDGSEGHLQVYADDSGTARLVNQATGQRPCIFHLNGGSSDPVRGKWDEMIGWWNRLYPAHPLEEGQLKDS